MTWFKVDDSFHSHPKVLAASPAALGLWVVAGSWSGANLSDGFIPDHVLPRLLPDSATLAKQLVSAGLWKRERGGYRFHDWGHFNPQAQTVHAEREAARQRMRAVRARRKEGTTKDQRADFEQDLIKGREEVEEPTSRDEPPDQPSDGSPEQPANVRHLFGYPDPTRPELRGGALSGPLTSGAHEPPSPRCSKHEDIDADGPCRACATARGRREAWDLADANRRRTQAKCRLHRGQPAGRCGLCRSEALAAEGDS